MSSPTHSSRRPIPALVFLLALAVLAVVVWVRVADRGSGADASAPKNCASAPQLPANAAVTVTVLNANGSDGLATRVLDAFVAAGFVAGNVGNVDTPAPDFATITSGPNGTAGALLVSYYIPHSTITTDDRQDTSVTVTVGQKFGAFATPQQAQAAMAKARVSQTPAAPTPGAKPTGKSASPTATCFTTPPVPSPPKSS